MATSPKISSVPGAEITTYDVHTAAGWITLKQARCPCGWKGERTYQTAEAATELVAHWNASPECLRTSPRSASREAQADRSALEAGGTRRELVAAGSRR